MNCDSDQWIGYWMRKVVRTINNVYDHKLQQYGLSGAQVPVMFNLWDKEGISQKDIQEKLNLTAASVSGLVDTLENKGFIIRKNDLEDGRSRRLYCTEQGKKLQKLCTDIISEIEGEIAEGFSEDEKKIFIAWMKKSYGNLKNLQNIE